MGYLGQPEGTAETFGTDWFLRTADVRFVDDKGFVRIVDWVKEMIKVEGAQVAPAELEDLLHKYPHVQDYVVLGFPDAYSGKRPKTHVVLKEGVNHSKLLGRELIDHVKKRRVRYKWIKDVEFTDVIPKNLSGKILRRILRDRDRNGAATSK